MRIISGQFGGLRINIPKNLPIRPTTDMAKEGVFNTLNSLDNFLIVDIGGRSTEFIYDSDKRIVSKSINIGVVTLSELFFNKLPPSEEKVLRHTRLHVHHRRILAGRPFWGALECAPFRHVRSEEMRHSSVAGLE